jgi:hypothetical protein
MAKRIVNTLLSLFIPISVISADTVDRCYAVIIGGGRNKITNEVRFWYDCSAIYTALVNVYGYSDSHIYVLMSDGTNPADDRCWEVGEYDSSPLDLNDDDIPDIDYSATDDNISAVFNILSNTLTSNDRLLIFISGHGGTGLVSGHPYVTLWNGELYATSFALELNKLHAGSVCIVMEQCYSGAFIPFIAKEGRIIITSCAADELSWANTLSISNEFAANWTIAVVSNFPMMGIGANANVNNDGYVSVKEAFDYAVAHKWQRETPQYCSNGLYLGDYVTLYDASCTEINVNNLTVDSTMNIPCCKINIEDVSVQNGANMVLDADGNVGVNGQFSIESGSGFEVRRE